MGEGVTYTWAMMPRFTEWGNDMAKNTKVIFRIWRKGRDVIALFPSLPGTYSPTTCTSYMHVGQHGSAYAGVIHGTRLAKPDEYKPLLAELVSIGYTELRIVKRFTRADYEVRKQGLV